MPILGSPNYLFVKIKLVVIIISALLMQSSASRPVIDLAIAMLRDVAAFCKCLDSQLRTVPNSETYIPRYETARPHSQFWSAKD